MENVKKFRSVYDRVRVESCPGIRTKKDRKMQINKETGLKELVVTGEFDFQDMIQASAESCDVENIINKYRLTGDAAILNRGNAIYGDFTDLPKNLMEMYSMVDSARAEFEKLPVEIKEQFNFNAGEFFASVGTDKFNNLFNKMNELVETSTNLEAVEKVLSKEVTNE